MPELLVDARAVSVLRSGRAILQNADLQLKRGEIVTLIGPNGAGKTTLVRLVLGLIRAERGEVWRQAGLRIGYMPQQIHIDPSLPLSVKRFLALARADSKAIDTALQQVGVGHLLDSPMRGLSGGETQRVLLARAILRRPQLLVLDEPVQGVDVSGQAEFYSTLSQLRDQLQCGVLMVSHDLHLVMAATDTVVCLNQHVCCQGHPEAVTSHPAYLELFGRDTRPGIAVYTHHHDHSHDIHGDVVESDGDREHA
ncbi:zinc ABC transporter ATP-binding protein ZnuC [Exilibacterium tricleocarpae]|uniref:Zinc ABC transporter ATP-binding protein ZnuC n=1 Tax=Exilibacterium tricleocarpae TaxID=2591008 RepID=A0A545T0K1_9GAMM|nr:zinc ABC transporter ATP-binding protein ZnuC [Exilibacterium tricleocarpae]TQV70730.1 zinc ABC transporter ATP-binding protein ZnuC [Exilibacterium tricleocarpae]